MFGRRIKFYSVTREIVQFKSMDEFYGRKRQDSISSLTEGHKVGCQPTN